ncbi:MAG TPA: DNA polymerase [Bacillota bacterium]|nr:DNA polymerase [Bacillota bacterium]
MSDNYLFTWAESRIQSIHESLRGEYVEGAFKWAKENAPEILEKVFETEERLNEICRAAAEGGASLAEIEDSCTAWESSLLALFQAAKKARAERISRPAPAAGTQNGNDRAKVVLSMPPEAALNPETVIVTSAEDLRAALVEASAAGICGVDTETTGPGKEGGLDPHMGEVRLVQLAIPTADAGVKVFVVDMFAVRDFSPFWEFWNDDGILKVMHNAKFDLKFFRKHLGRRLPPGRLFDTMLASQLLACGLDVGSHSLSGACSRFLGFSLDKEERLSDWSRELSAAQIEYAVRDSAVLLPLCAAEMRELAKEGLNRAAKIEFDCCFATADMEYHGMPFDAERCRELLEREEEREKELRSRLMRELAPALEQGLFGAKEINPNSPAQLLPVLRTLGVDVPDTMDDTLRLRYPDHPAVKALLEYRKAEKKLSAFLRPYLNAVHPVTGRIHPEFIQINRQGVGRFSCREPNVQQSVRDKDFRKIFRVQSGNKLIISDYNQVELRVAAYYSKDKRMLEAYHKGEDLHTVTAALTAGINIEQVTKDLRQKAKPVNFGLVYGMSWKTLKVYAKTNYGIELSDNEAQSLREAFFRAYPGIALWHKNQKSSAEINQYVRTISGRKRRWVSEGKPPVTQFYNSPVQGSAADILKVAMSNFYRKIYINELEKVFLVNSIHDELIVEVPTNKSKEVEKILKDSMEDAGNELIGGLVPIVAETVIGDSWTDK